MFNPLTIHSLLFTNTITVPTFWAPLLGELLVFVFFLIFKARKLVIEHNNLGLFSR